jgi:hypothetical protein
MKMGEWSRDVVLDVAGRREEPLDVYETAAVLYR